MRIIDSPGVVFDEDSYDDGKGSKKGNVLLRNVVKVEDVENSRLKFRKARLQTGDFLSIWKNTVTEYTGSSAYFFTQQKRKGSR